MFHDHQLSTTLTADRQTRLRDAAARQRLVRPNKAPPAGGPSAVVSSLVWRDDYERTVSEHRVHCVA